MLFIYMKTTITVFIILFTTLISLGQTDYYGRIVNENQEPLAYAQIRAIQAKQGTITNEDGYFRLRFTGGQNDTIQFSHIGFEIQRLPVADIQKGKELNIILKERVLELEEVVIRPVEAEDLLRQALAEIPENYGHNPVNMRGFYRELMKFDQTPVKLAEAVLDIYKLGNKLEYERGNRVKLIKGRSFKDTTSLDTINASASMGGGGGPKTSVGMSVICDVAGEHFLFEKEFKHFEYHIDGITTYNNRDVYKISFDQKEKLNRRLYQGEIFLDVKTMAFVSIRYRLSERGKKFKLARAAGLGGGAAMAMLRILGIRLDYYKENGQIDFVYDGGYWYENYLNRDIGIIISSSGKRPEIPKHLDLSVSQELVITEKFQGQANQFRDEELINDSVELSEQMGEFDEDFWSSYNFLKPTDSLKELVDRIGK